MMWHSTAPSIIDVSAPDSDLITEDTTVAGTLTSMPSTTKKNPFVAELSSGTMRAPVETRHQKW
jgi:hypothetical protein